MTDPTETSRDAQVERVLELAIRLGLVAVMLALSYWIVQPFLIPIAWAIIIAVAAWPGYQRLLNLFRGRRTPASVVFVLIALIILILPVALLSGTLVDGVHGLARTLSAGQVELPEVLDLKDLPLVGPEIHAFYIDASEDLEASLRTIEPQLRTVGTWLLGLATHAGIGLLHFVIAILIAAVLLAKSDAGARVTRAIARRVVGERGDALAKLAESVVRSVSRGVIGVALIQSILAGLGMLVAGVPAAGLWALLALLLAVVQVGAFWVLLPVAIYLFYSASLTTAVLFAAWAIFVGSIDNVLKPLLLGRGVSVPMMVIFIGAIGGFLGAGIIGLFVGAVVLSLSYELFLVWLREGADGQEDGQGADG
ncbi:AI-2E family transporter [Thiohalocapsa marina]|uniref:AI-2E family transporter n=1 Tax=Thiohalocapsa marina TaxID=424902 RepID=UPI0036DAF62A